MPADAEEEIRAAYWHPQAGDVVLDIGSCDGAYTLPALDAGATVYAVDARLHTLDALPEHPRLTAIHAAVFDGGSYPPALLKQIAAGPLSAREMIPDAPWTTVDAIVQAQAITALDWLKVDVEGGELGVMQGATAALRTLRPYVLIEEHSRVYRWTRDQQTAIELRALLRGAGYSTAFHRTPGVVDYVIGLP